MLNFGNIEQERKTEKFKKIESISEQGDGLVNEDVVLAGPESFGVFDGATGLDKYVDSQGKTGGYLAAQAAKEAFSENNASLVDLALSANRKIMEEMVKNNVDIDKKSNFWCTTFAAVRIKEKQMEWAQISDASILLIYEDNSFKTLGGDYSFDKPSLIEWKKLSGPREEKIGKIKDQLLQVREGMNKNYGVLNGEESMVNFLKSGQEPLDKVKHILVFSDGILLPKTDPEAEEDFSTMVNLYLEGGLERVKEYVRGLENSDPECEQFPRFKNHDDMGAVAISL